MAGLHRFHWVEEGQGGGGREWGGGVPLWLFRERGRSSRGLNSGDVHRSMIARGFSRMP